MSLTRRLATPPPLPPTPPPPPSSDGGEATDVDDDNDAGVFLPLDPLILVFAFRVSRCLEAFCNVCRPWPVMDISPSRASSATERSPEAKMKA